MVATLDQPEKLSAVEAVNIMLSAYGEARVSDLGENADAVKAEKVLIQTLMQEATNGYKFCTTESMILEPGEDGKIPVGETWTQVVPTGSSEGLDIIQLNGYLYDRENSTDVFSSSVTANVTQAMIWADLPQPAAWLIAYRAAIAFVSSEKSGDPVLRELERQALAAKITLEQYDSRLRQGGLVARNPHFSRIRKRRRRSL